MTMTKELLSVDKFVRDVTNLLGKAQPMPGTILEPRTGLPEALPALPELRVAHPNTFPNRLIRRGMRSQILELLRPVPGKPPPRPTIDTVRQMLELVLTDNRLVRTIDGQDVGVIGAATGALRASYRLPAASKLAVRKMMSRYWENFSPFALDLVSAMMRQSLFTDKMIKVCFVPMFQLSIYKYLDLGFCMCVCMCVYVCISVYG